MHTQGSDPDPLAPLLVGVGVGPGDPELITAKALRVLASAEVILVPATEASGSQAGRAEAIVLANLPELAERITRVPFSMATRTGLSEQRLASWQSSARAVLDAIAAGARTICLATVGDPSVFSTFSYLVGTVREQVPGLRVEVVPGITAMQALAAAAGTPLCEGTEVLALVPVTAGLETLDKVLQVADTVVAYKAGRRLPEVLDHLAVAGRSAQTIVGTNLGLPEERISTAEDTPRDTASYFSTVLSAPRRDQTGGRL